MNNPVMFTDPSGNKVVVTYTGNAALEKLASWAGVTTGTIAVLVTELTGLAVPGVSVIAALAAFATINSNC